MSAHAHNDGHGHGELQMGHHHVSSSAMFMNVLVALLILTALQPWLQKLGIGRLPGDVRIKRKGREIVLPFTSTVLLTLLLTLLARLL